MPVAQHQDEERTIGALSADGKTVTLDRPLAYQHGDIFGYAEAVPVGNLSRNVIIESENARDVSRHGHIMFMHTQDVVLDSVLFHDLGRTNVEGALTSPRLKDGKLVAGTDANTIGRYAVHFHIRWGATYKQQPFVVRNSAIVGSPKLGVVNHGGHGLVDDNVAYKVRGSHFFTENGSEIGRFKGNLAVRSHGTGFDGGDDDGMPIPQKYAYNHPLNIGHGGHGFWLQGGGVDMLDNVAIGHSYSAYGFFVANNRIVTYGGPQEPNNPLTKGTPWQRLDIFLAENLKDPSLAHGQRFVHTSAVPFHMARCIGLASRVGLRTRGIDRTEFLVLHDKLDQVEDCRFVWNETGYLLGYSPGRTHLHNTTFIGGDPARSGLPETGIGGANHIPGFLTLDNVTIDGYRTGCSPPGPRQPRHQGRPYQRRPQARRPHAVGRQARRRRRQVRHHEGRGASANYFRGRPPRASFIWRPSLLELDAEAPALRVRLQRPAGLPRRPEARRRPLRCPRQALVQLLRHARPWAAERQDGPATVGAIPPRHRRPAGSGRPDPLPRHPRRLLRPQCSLRSADRIRAEHGLLRRQALRVSIRQGEAR